MKSIKHFKTIFFTVKECKNIILSKKHELSLFEL